MLQILFEWKESQAEGLCQPRCTEHVAMPDLGSAECDCRGGSPDVAQ
jgi:hypothetical protein